MKQCRQETLRAWNQCGSVMLTREGPMPQTPCRGSRQAARGRQRGWRKVTFVCRLDNKEDDVSTVRARNV